MKDLCTNYIIENNDEGSFLESRKGLNPFSNYTCADFKKCCKKYKKGKRCKKCPKR